MVENKKKEASVLDPEKGLERFMGNQGLYCQYLEKFFYDPVFQEFMKGLALGDQGMANKALITLKGTAANLSMDRLVQTVDAALNGLRTCDSEEELQRLMDSVTEAYATACEAARAYMEQNNPS